MFKAHSECHSSFWQSVIHSIFSPTRDSEHEGDDLAEPEFRGLWEEDEKNENKVKQGIVFHSNAIL